MGHSEAYGTRHIYSSGCSTVLKIRGYDDLHLDGGQSKNDIVVLGDLNRCFHLGEYT